jgi:NADH-quinone oxidoreductase subunit M
MLVAIIYLSSASGGTFDYVDVRRGLQTSAEAQRWLFLAFAVAFAVKVPMFPVHTWLPDAHTEAPTAGSVILAGVLLKMGTFGFFRYALPLFPEAALHFRTLFVTLAVVGIVYGALMCFVQKDMKRLVAYSSVSHMGFVMLGLMAITAEGLTGGVYQMLNHGVSTGSLFLLVGMLYERRHTRLISEYGGIARRVPWIATAFVIVTLSSIGSPGPTGSWASSSSSPARGWAASPTRRGSPPSAPPASSWARSTCWCWWSGSSSASSPTPRTRTSATCRCASGS